MRIRNTITVAAVAALALCSCGQEPRSVSFFRAEEAERAKVIADCRTGSHRGTECNNAETAQAQAQHARSAEEFRRGF